MTCQSHLRLTFDGGQQEQTQKRGNQIDARLLSAVFRGNIRQIAAYGMMLCQCGSRSTTRHTDNRLHRGRTAQNECRMLLEHWKHEYLDSHGNVIQYIRTDAPFFRVDVQFRAAKAKITI